MPPAVLLDKAIWALTLLYFIGLVAAVVTVHMRFMFDEGYKRGKQDSTPVRAKNGQFIGRGE